MAPADTTPQADAPASAQELQPPPRIPEVCGNCEGWRALGGNPAFGQCLPSGKALQAPLVTPNRSSCTGWVLAKRLAR